MARHLRGCLPMTLEAFPFARYPGTFSSVVHECCERPTEVDLRKRIAQEIGQEWQRRSDEWGYRVDSHQEGVLDGLAEAEEIARGIDPGEVE